MTAEERMAYFQGERKRTPAFKSEKNERNFDKFFLKVKFMIAVILFVIFLSMDYTGYEIQGIGSEQIVEEVTKNIELPKLLNL